MSSSREHGSLDLSIIIAGQAGQGVQIASELLGRCFFRFGYDVFGSMDVMSRIRGGHNFSRLRVSESRAAGNAGDAQLLVALDAGSIAAHLEDLADGAVVLAEEGDIPDCGGRVKLVQGPLGEIAVKNGGRRVMANMVASGAVLALMEMETGPLCDLLEHRLRPFGDALTDGNIACVSGGYDFIRSRARFGTLARLQRGPRRAADRYFMSGAQAIALGAIAAGVRLVAGYPMSPGTPILESCARWADRVGVVVEQTEDEIAAVNFAIGASFAGIPSMVATAGGGLALMNEGLSLAGMTETPVTVCSGMRPGPATGLATRTSQADLLFAVHSGHGEFPKAVFCPGDGEQAFRATYRACRIAAEAQVPTVVLFDQFLGDSLWSLEGIEFGAFRTGGDTRSSSGRDALPFTYNRYALTESGVSPVVTPGTRGQLVYADSDEHSVEGHITESAAVRVQMVDKRAKKRRVVEAGQQKPTIFPSVEAEMLVYCFGSTKPAVAEAVGRLRDAGHAVSMIHICDVWPFPTTAILQLTGKCPSLLTVEVNSTAQLARLLSQECGLRVRHSVCRYDGRQPAADEIEHELNRALVGVKS